MATKSNSMFRISQLAKDLGLKTKELTEKLNELGVSTKNTSASLEPDEVNLLFESLSKDSEIKDIDGYLRGKTVITLPESPEESATRLKQEKAEAEAKAKAEAEAKAKAEAEAKAKAEAEAKAKAEAEAKAKAEAEAKAKAEAEAKAKAEAEAKAKAEAEAKAKAEAEAKAKAEAEAKAKAEAEAKAKAEAEAKAKAEAEAKAANETKSTTNTQDKYMNDNNSASQNRQQNQRNDNRGERKPFNRDNSGNNQRPSAPRNDNNRDNNNRQNDNRNDNNRNGNGFKPNNNRDGNSFRGSDKDSGRDRAPIAPKPKPKIESGVEKKRTGNTRIVDTRTSSVDLSKYDERLENFSPEVDDAHSTKQKVKKQNQRPENRGTGKKNDKERFAMEKLKKANLEKAKKQPLKITIPDEITVGELAQRLKVTAAECVKKLMLMGVMATVNQVIDYDTAYLIADEMGAVVTKEVKVTIEDKLFSEEPENEEDLVTRAPVVCVMGHVDHGKTSILDAIRHTSVTAGEAGGITQHIGAYRVHVNGRDITFLDTPGHEAFTAMRARGAQCTDIAILVVAGDDGIMPQTVEAINHAKAAGVDIIVAINKMDKPHANADNVKNELTKYDLVPEEWGGDVMCVPVSALTKMGINDLLEDILLIADVKEYKANPHKRAKGVVIEAKLDKGRGPVATVLVQDGTLRNGDIVIAGTSVGRVRAMVNDRGEQLTEAGPSVPVEIIGLSEVPLAGDEFNAVEDERMARELADQRREKAKEEVFKQSAKVNLDDLFSQIAAGVKELNIIVKADVGGSAEAVKQSLEKISNDEVKVRVIHAGVGGITESDVMFAAASNAIIVGFNVRPDKSALDSAERQNVDIRTYRIIYECIEEIKAAMKGMLAPTFKEVLQGHIEVRQTIKVPNVGIIAGSYVLDGKVTRQSQIRIVRDGIVIMEDKISSLRRFKDDVKEVAAGYECGIGLEKCLDIQVGDIFEAFIMEEVEK
ncbi:MAG: translation initiation factor IF-2 [Clostridia bacterium]|nr:translation initiation factor IF-2 [Clostridia bacterium]